MPVAKQETVKATQLLSMIKLQNYRCAYSGRELTPETATVDHRQPVSRGGPHTIENLAIVHMDVNRAKSSLTLEEFIRLCRDVVSWADRSESADVLTTATGSLEAA